MISYQDELGHGAAPLECYGCGKKTPVWALYRGDPAKGEPEGWICGLCIQSARRDREAAAEAAAKLPASDWNSDLGIFLKAERLRLLETWRWTVANDTPLSEASRAEFMAYLAVLNRMTVDCADPTTWAWPEAPTPAFD